MPVSMNSHRLEDRLRGRVALVTGAARGIGLATAQRLAAEGATVLLIDRDELVREEAAALDQPCLQLDLLDENAVARMFDHLLERLGAPDILVNNAGLTRTAEFLDLAIGDYELVMALNARVPMLATQRAAREMIRAGKAGSIINIASVSGTLGVGNQVAYGMSKGAVRQLSVSAAVALAPHQIRVNAIAPGTIETELVRSVMTEEVERAVLSRTPLGRLARPEEIASAVAFLASDDASYMTGQTLYVDGGRTSLNLTIDPPSSV